MPTIQIPADHFFKRAKGEYRDWKRALAREFIQNSLDAGASRVSFQTTPVDDKHFALTVIDDGRGASEKVLVERLLTLGGSFKDSETAVGGFGAAKELLYFAWPEWSIHTHGSLVQGKAGSYELEKASTSFPGFYARIVVPTEYVSEGDLLRAFLNYLGRVETDAFVTLNGTAVVQQVKRGPRAVKVIENVAKFYRVKGVADSYIHVRINGVEMFQSWSGHSDEVGQIIVELQGKSVDLLTSNRDGLRSDSLQRMMTDFVVALDRAGAKALKGTEEKDNTIFFNMKPARPAQPKGDEHLKRTVVGDSYGTHAQHVGYGATAAGGTGSMVPGVVHADMQSTPRAPAQVTPPSIDLSEFDFAVHFKGRPTKAIKALAKRRTLKLLRAWSVIVREVADMSGTNIDAVGITMMDDANAECIESGDRRAVLFNPTSSHLGQKVDFEELLSLATHEVAHLRSSNGHDERWATAEINLRRKFFGSPEKVLRARVKAALKGM